MKIYTDFSMKKNEFARTLAPQYSNISVAYIFAPRFDYHHNLITNIFRMAFKVY